MVWAVFESDSSSQQAANVGFGYRPGAPDSQTWANGTDSSSGAHDGATSEWKIWQQGDTCFVEISGDAREAEAVEAAQRLTSMLERARTPMRLVLDMLEVTSYDQGSRLEWQAVLRENQHHVRETIFLLENPVFRMAGSAVALFTGLPIRVLGAKDRDRYMSVPRLDPTGT